MDELLGKTLDSFVKEHLLMSVATAKQGISLDVTYQVWLRADDSVDAFVKALNRTEGIQSVRLERRRESEA